MALLLTSLIVAFGALLRLSAPPVRSRTPDEYVYTLYAQALAHGERVHTGEVLKLVARTPELTAYPSPTRIGYLWLVSGMMRLTGNASTGSAALVSTLASVLTLFLLAALAAAFLGPEAAAVAALFLATSPLDLAIARRAWQDGVLALWALAAAWAFLRYVTDPARTRWAVLCLALAAYTVLIKESGLVLLALATAGIALVAWRASRGLLAPLRAALGGLAALGAAALVLALHCGGWSPLRDALVRTATSEWTSEYTRKYQTGSVLYYVSGLGALHPVPFLLGYLGAALAALRTPFLLDHWERPAARRVLIALAWFVIAFTGVVAGYHLKNLRLLSVVYGPVYLLAAALVWSALSWLARRVPARAFALGIGAVAVALLASSYLDLRRFHDLFIRREVPDLATPWFVGGPR